MQGRKKKKTGKGEGGREVSEKWRKDAGVQEKQNKGRRQGRRKKAGNEYVRRKGRRRQGRKREAEKEGGNILKK